MQNHQTKQPSQGFRPFVSSILTILIICSVTGAAALGLFSCQQKPSKTAVHAVDLIQNNQFALFFSKSLPETTPLKEQSTVSVYKAEKPPGRYPAMAIRKLPEQVNGSLLAYVLTALLKGPNKAEQQQGFYTEIPPGTELLGITLNEENVTINLSKQFEQGGGANSLSKRFEEIKQTVFALETNKKIHLAIEGKVINVLGGEGLEVEDELKRSIQ
ncbi:MAG: GerMN domain-containing protein [Cyanobacteria bacterium P01_H01_bin.74]